jgi:hypothetical protein
MTLITDYNTAQVLYSNKLQFHFLVGQSLSTLQQELFAIALPCHIYLKALLTKTAITRFFVKAYPIGASLKQRWGQGFSESSKSFAALLGHYDIDNHDCFYEAIRQPKSF